MSSITQVVKCPECHKGVPLNPNKHRNREKQCPFCRNVLIGPQISFLSRVLNEFQKIKKLRKAITRERFIERMHFLGFDDHHIASKLERRFGEEN